MDVWETGNLDVWDLIPGSGQIGELPEGDYEDFKFNFCVWLLIDLASGVWTDRRNLWSSSKTLSTKPLQIYNNHTDMTYLHITHTIHLDPYIEFGFQTRDLKPNYI